LITLFSVRNTPQAVCRSFVTRFTSRHTGDSPEAFEWLHRLSSLS
jgi:hypothetical protein